MSICAHKKGKIMFVVICRKDSDQRLISYLIAAQSERSLREVWKKRMRGFGEVGEVVAVEGVSLPLEDAKVLFAVAEEHHDQFSELLSAAFRGGVSSVEGNVPGRRKSRLVKTLNELM